MNFQSNFKTVRRRKYGETRASFNGKTYHSAKERNDAIWLHSLVKSKKIKQVEEQVRLRIVINTIHICDCIVDFRVTLNDDRIKWVETKGFPTDVWKLKRKLIDAVEVLPYLVNPTEKELFA